MTTNSQSASRLLHRLPALLLALGLAMGASAEQQAQATFAGGCFWCVEKAFDEVEGVTDTRSGYANGHVEDPSYEQVSAGGTGHYEAVRVTYDSDRVGYRRLLEVYWANIDPLDDGGQFCDRGASYRSAIFYHDDRQRQLAQTSRQRLAERYEPGEIATSVEPLESFYEAEDYHQDYYRKNPLSYRFYVWNCGRHNRLETLWGEAAAERLELFASR